MDKSYVDYTLLQPLTNQTEHGDLTKYRFRLEGLSDYFNQATAFFLILIAITAVFYFDIWWYGVSNYRHSQQTKTGQGGDCARD